MPRLFFMLLLAVTLAAFVPVGAAPVPKVPRDPTKDRDGNPLPKGATARLGSRPFHGQARPLAFSTDGQKLLSIPNPERVLAWETDTGTPLPPRPIKWAAESDGEQAIADVIAGNRAIWITQPINKAMPDQTDPKAVSTAYSFDLADGGEVARVKFTGRVLSDVLAHQTFEVAVSADGKYLAVAPEQTKTVVVFDMETGKHLHTQKTGEFGGYVHISPDSKTLYVAEHKQPLRRFELLSGKELPSVAGTDGSIDLFEASADGKRLAARSQVSRDNEGKQFDTFLTVHDMANNKPLGKLELGGIPLDFGFAGSDAVIVLSSGFNPPFPRTYTISRWNATTLKKEWQVRAPTLPDWIFFRLIVSPDGKRFVFTDQTNFVHMYDAVTGKMVIEPYGHDTLVSWVGFSQDGQRITTVGWDGVRTWTPSGERKNFVSLPELSRGRIHPTLLGEHPVWVTLAEDGKSAQLVGWDLVSGKIGWRMPVDGDGPERILTSDGKKCVGIAWNAAKLLWDVTVYDGPSSKKLHSWTYDKVDKRGGVGWWPMALSADGNTLFVGADGIVGWDVSTGKETLRIKAGWFEPDRGEAAFPMAVSSDGKRIAVIRAERQLGYFVRVFDIMTGDELAAHVLDDVYHPALRFSPSGKQVAVLNVRGRTVHVCDAASSEKPPRKLVGDSSRAWCAAFSPNEASLAVGYEDGTTLIWDLSAK
jgi:WD40 repeat protein